MTSLVFEYLEPEPIIGSDDFVFVERFLRDTGRTQIGWHYFVDLTWIYSQLKDLPAGARILDAGGGAGPAQFLFAELGFHVTNVDLFHHEPSRWLRNRYGITRRTLNSFEKTDYSDHLASLRRRGVLGAIRGYARKWPFAIASFEGYRSWRLQKWRQRTSLIDRPIGKIEWIQGNLASLPELADQSFDAVISLSAVEHIPTELLGAAISELRRVVKRGAAWAITTSATERPETWWHEPSKGHCFSVDDLDKVFGAASARQQDASTVLEQYRRSRYLETNLARFYRKSGENGMPWGVWDPQYIPVGIFERALPKR